ncbi:uncharacterized protein [Dermacentor andersoni]|uniref:uncharacterized protein isoform X3 n=1 Tax=Dermacentor andersoni TaxID=34620 RepID=UPI003B3B76EB
MAQVLLCGFKPISKLDGWIRPAIRRKGEKLYAAGHVNSVKEIAGVTVLAKCHSQQGKHNYSVSLDLNKADRALSGGSCTCRYGASGNCKHCAAVVIYINESEDVSTTSQPQQWGRPPKTSFINDKASIELFGENTHPYVAGK